MEKIELKKLDVKVVALICVVLIGLFYTVAEVNKSRSIERQNEAKISMERLLLEEEKCQTTLVVLQTQYNNVIASEYSEEYGECVITYLDDNENMKSSPLSLSGTVKE